MGESGSCSDEWSHAESMPVWDILKEVAIIFITSTAVWPQVKQAKQQGGNTAPPIYIKLD